MSKKPSPSTIAVNKKARHLYELSDFVEAGISLTGPEVKSIRAGKINFLDSYVDFRDGEAFVLSLHIAPYDNAGYVPQDPDRPRRLLLHAAEIPTVGVVCCCTARRSTFLTANFATVVMRWFRWSSTLIPTAA